MTTPGLRYYVTVAFRQGYGETFTARSSALEYAEQQLQKLLAEHNELEHEDFAGIYCELEGTQQLWRFEYDQGKPAWMRISERTPGAIVRRASP
jgi:hypothetical protein